MEERDPRAEPRLIVPLAQQGGVWANWVRVDHSEHEFTLEFARLEPGRIDRGIVVARVALSPVLALELRRSLRVEWDNFSAQAMPWEVREAGETAEKEEPDDDVDTDLER